MGCAAPKTHPQCNNSLCLSGQHGRPTWGKGTARIPVRDGKSLGCHGAAPWGGQQHLHTWAGLGACQGQQHPLPVQLSDTHTAPFPSAAQSATSHPFLPNFTRAPARSHAGVPEPHPTHLSHRGCQKHCRGGCTQKNNKQKNPAEFCTSQTARF